MHGTNADRQHFSAVQRLPVLPQPPPCHPLACMPPCCRCAVPAVPAYRCSAHTREVQQEFQALFQVGGGCSAWPWPLPCLPPIFWMLLLLLPPLTTAAQLQQPFASAAPSVCLPRARPCASPVPACHLPTWRLLLQFKALLFLEELSSILLTPLLLWFSLPQCAGGCPPACSCRCAAAACTRMHAATRLLVPAPAVDSGA